MTFNTVEDVNGAVFDHQGFWWYEVDLSEITTDTEDYSDVKVDFCRISRTKLTNDNYQFTVVIDNSLWTNGFVLKYVDGTQISYYSISCDYQQYPLKFTVNVPNVILCLYMGTSKINFDPTYKVYYVSLRYINTGSIFNVTYNRLHKPFTFGFRASEESGTGYAHTVNSLEQGYVLLYQQWVNGLIAGFVLVRLVRTDFQFDCTQSLIVGEVNTVCLGTASDYKVGGDLVGEYETKLSVLYNGKTIPVVWNETLNDYTFDLDLSNVTEEKKIRFKVIVETNDVLNASETDVVLDANFETINTLAKLTELFSMGGVGRLGADLTLTNDLTLTKSVNLIGNDCTIDMANHKISVGSDKTFKAQTLNFSNGVNTIQQEPNSNVELSDCTFTDCTGFGSVIDCQVDLASLDETDDFNTKLTNCTITNCDMAILSGGNLEVNGCSVIGKISNKNYPYFLYQTDGNATILNSEFNLTDTTVYDYDIEFNSCIFVCGETATINGYSHTELQQNNLTAFFETQRNTSTIDVKYYYSLIEDTVHLKSNKGYCHSVSGVDYIFKSNVTITRGE